uniref:Uncharacterized protein n=1 Tax=Aegilops tauschii subsp. strangulata TaxID=200361 RepID=A0A453NIJ0_AEGTS
KLVHQGGRHQKAHEPTEPPLSVAGTFSAAAPPSRLHRRRPRFSTAGCQPNRRLYQIGHHRILLAIPLKHQQIYGDRSNQRSGPP